jgi:hypothetical protein
MRGVISTSDGWPFDSKMDKSSDARALSAPFRATQALSTARDQIVSACTGAAVDGLDVLAIQRGAVPIHVFTVALLPLAALAAARSGLGSPA